MSTHCPNLQELRIGSIKHLGPMTVFQLSHPEAEKICTVARGLRTLQICPYVTESDDDSENAKQHHCLGRVLQGAKELRNLASSGLTICSLDDEDGSFHLRGRTDFGLSLGKQWPHLTELTLREACIEARDLMSILRAHKETLRELILSELIWPGEESWEGFGKETDISSSYISLGQEGSTTSAPASTNLCVSHPCGHRCLPQHTSRRDQN